MAQNVIEIFKERLRIALERAGISPTKLANDIQRDRNFIRDLFKGKKKTINAADLSRIAERLDVSAAWLTGEDNRALVRPAAGRPIGSAAPLLYTKTIPLYGQASAGEDGRFLLSGERLAELACPPQLERVKDPYAVSIFGDSMEPRFRSGAIAFVNPSRAPRRDDVVVVQVKDGDETWGYLKELVSMGTEKTVLRQLNPEKKITISSDRIKAVHVVNLVEM